MGIFDKLRQGLSRTREELLRDFRGTFGVGVLDEAKLEELGDHLIHADVGVETVDAIVEELRQRAFGRTYSSTEELMGWLEEVAVDHMGDPSPLELGPGLQVVLIVGVNGAGKTTTIGKLARLFTDEGRKVLVGACDTFRAAAVEQLETWCTRAGVPCVRQKQGSDPAAVAYDAVAAAKARGCDVVLLDTAGRLHNRAELMKELGKMVRVVRQHGADFPQHTWLVIDGNTGQNALRQAQVFGETVPLTGLVVTKLDGTAKGGALLSVRQISPAPPLFIGVGEAIDDLERFDARAYCAGLFGRGDAR